MYKIVVIDVTFWCDIKYIMFQEICSFTFNSPLSVTFILEDFCLPLNKLYKLMLKCLTIYRSLYVFVQDLSRFSRAEICCYSLVAALFWSLVS